jgi:hypothetical protein
MNDRMGLLAFSLSTPLTDERPLAVPGSAADLQLGAARTAIPT